MNKLFFQKEKGQSFIFVAILIVALVGMLALVIDGGIVYSNRRSAQNAADAGALAGVQELCNGGTEASAITIAETYAITNNQATGATVTPHASTYSLDVTAWITHNSFFAGILGQDVVTSTATASAECTNPCEGPILPIAWSCRPPVGADPFTGSCDIFRNPNQIYVIMDSDKTCTGDPTDPADCYCQEPPNSGLPAGAIDCDLYDAVNKVPGNDGINDLSTGGNRSWLYLDESSNEIKDFITGDASTSVDIHTWMRGDPGNMDSLYKEVKDLVGKDVVLPIYDKVCDGVPRVDCPSLWCGDDIDNPYDGKNVTNFHIIEFSYFHITCVFDAPKGYNEDGSKICPGRDAAFAANPALKANLNSIEGYFKEEYVPGMEGKCGPYDGSGPFTIFLK